MSFIPQPIVNVRDFGAVGDGVSDDTARFQAAIDYLYALGGGQATVPITSAFYSITSPLILRAGVSLIGDRHRPKIQNVTAAGGIGIQEVLLPGNFHPSYTQYLQQPGSTTNPLGGTCVGCSVGAVTPGYTVTLATPADAAKFAVGNQVWVFSNDGGLASSTWFLPHYGYLNVITAINGSVLTLREPIDQSFNGTIAVPSWINGRNYPLFFSQDASVENLEIVTTNYKWTNDTACLNVHFRNLRVTSDVAIYGNTFQSCSWEDSDFYWAQQIGEESHTSYRTKAVRCRFINQPRAGVTPSIGISIQEYARYIDYEDCLMYCAPNQAGALLTTINAAYIHFRRIRGIQTNAAGASNYITYAGSADTAWPSVDCVIEDSDFQVTAVGRYYFADPSVIQSQQTGNGMRRVRFTGGAASTADSVSLLLTQGCFVKDCEIPGGVFNVTGTSNDVRANTVSSFTAQTNASDSAYQGNFIRANKSAVSAAKAQLKYSNAAIISVPNNTPTSVYSVVVGSGWVIRDRINFDMQVDANGTTGDRTLQFHLFDNNTSGDLATQTATILAASSGSHRITGYFEFKSAEVIWSFTVFLAANTVLNYTGKGAYAVSSANPNVTVKIDGNCATGNSQMQIQNLEVDYANPFYA